MSTLIVDFTITRLESKLPVGILGSLCRARKTALRGGWGYRADCHA